MTSFTLRRVLNLIPTFLIATFVAWMVIDLAPGDFADQFAFNELDPNQAERMREVLGLNQPGPVRYVYWLRNLVLNFDLGTSMRSRADVMTAIGPRMINSLRLLAVSLVLQYLIAIPIGVYSAVRKYSFGDRVLTVFSLIGLAIPNFFFALLMVAFLVQWRLSTGSFLLPVGGMTSQNFARLGQWEQVLDIARHMIGPVLVITLSSLAGITRIMRGQMLEALSQDYVRTARAKGLATNRVNYKHALRNAIVPLVAVVGSELPGLISGAGLVEFVFRWPGLTPYLLSSIFTRDVYVVMAILTITTLLLMVGNLVSDLLLAVIDPRIRY